MTFWNKATETEQLVLAKGKIDPDRPTLVRMHVLSPFDDVLGETGARSGMLQRSMEIIGEVGAGVIVLLNRTSADAFSTAVRVKNGDATVEEREALRDYGVGASILTELGVREMELLTNTHHTLVGLDGYGLSIVGERHIDCHRG